MTLKEAIANRIIQLCEKRQLTVYSLAMICGIDRTTLYSIIGNKSNNPEVTTIKKIVMDWKSLWENFSVRPNLIT